MIWVAWATLIIFILVYLLIIFYYEKKFVFVWISVVLLLLIKSITIKDAVFSIDWNVIMLYIGMLFVSAVFLYSKMPDYLANHFASKAKKTYLIMITICIFSGFLSIFLENVAVVLLVAPIALSISKKCKINPIPLFIGIAIMSNLQGSSTLIGDPPSMLLASFANLKFNDFFMFQGKPGIFFAIQIGMLFSLLVLYFFFRKYNKKIQHIHNVKYISIIPSYIVILLVASLIIASMTLDFIYINGILCMFFGLISFIWYALNVKKINIDIPSNSVTLQSGISYRHSRTKDGIINGNVYKKRIKHFLSDLDWNTGLFLIGVFILVESLSINGLLNKVADFILYLGNNSILITFIIIILITLVLSAFVDNIPFLLAMLPVVQKITPALNSNSYLFYFVLLIAASVGGNITPIGASANIVAMSIAKKQGYKSTFWDFVKIGLPFTLISVTASAIFIWIFWH